MCLSCWGYFCLGWRNADLGNNLRLGWRGNQWALLSLFRLPAFRLTTHPILKFSSLLGSTLLLFFGFSPTALDALVQTSFPTSILHPSSLLSGPGCWLLFYNSLTLSLSLCYLTHCQGFNYHLYFDDAQIYISGPHFFLQFNTYMSNCLLGMATWLPNRSLKLNT